MAQVDGNRYTEVMHRPEDTGRRHGKGGGSGDRDEGRRLPRRDRAGVGGVPASRSESDLAESDIAGEEPMYVFTAAEARELDRRCASEFGLPSIVLMENAALGIASVARDQIEGVSDPCVLVFCGPGNNGGDGLATARHLANDGVAVSIVISHPGERYSGDAMINLEIAGKMGIPIACAEPSARDAVAAARAELGDPDLVIDALLGTGLDRAPEGVMAELIDQVNALKAEGITILSVDVPSGLDADRGQPAGRDAVRADITVALLGLKPGYMTLAAQAFLGDCLLAGIGAPRTLIERIGRPMGAFGKGADGVEGQHPKSP